MKKIFMLLVMFVGLMVSAMASNSFVEPQQEYSQIDDESSLVFRGTQKFRSNDGRELYCYTSGKCEMYDGDRLIVSCTYTYSDGDIRLLDENGNTIYKGSVHWNNSHSKPISITIAGTTYRNKDLNK